MPIRELCLHLTRRCNQACLHCYYQSSPNSKGDMALQVAKRLIFESKQAGVKRVTLQGGEPFLYDGLKELCEISKAEGLIVAIVTNGQLVDQKKIDWLKELVDILFVSIHGDDAFHDEFVQCKGAFKAAINNARLFINSGIKTGILTSVSKQNQKYIPEFSKAIDLIGAKYHGILYHSEVGRGSQIKSMDIEEWEVFIDEMRLIQQSLSYTRLRFETLRQPVSLLHSKKICNCLGMEKHICFIDTEGWIYPCSLGMGNSKIRYGNIEEISLYDYFRGISWEWAFTKSPIAQSCKSCPLFDVCKGGCFIRRLMNYKNCCNNAKYIPTCILYPDIDVYEEILALKGVDNIACPSN